MRPAASVGSVSTWRMPGLMLLGYSVVWSISAYKPWFPRDWLLENILVFIAIPLLVFTRTRFRFSNTNYGLICIFLCFHSVGAHYTYAEVPYAQWLNWNIDGRNHYDRLVHFLFGALIYPALYELCNARFSLRGIWRSLVPLSLIMAQSELYEIIEWQAAVWFGGELGQAYLGTQGDVWDAQKDSFAAALGALLSIGFVKYLRPAP